MKSVELEFWQFAFLEFYPFLPFGFSRLASWGQSVPHSIHRSDVLPQSAKEQKSKRPKREKGNDFKSEFARIHSSQISMESVC